MKEMRKKYGGIGKMNFEKKNNIVANNLNLNI